MNTIEEILAGDTYDLVSVAKILSVSDRTVRRLIERGQLEAVQVSERKQIVTKEQLHTYLVSVGTIRKKNDTN